MKYICPLIAVKNIEQSKRFYHDVLGLDVVTDYGANVTLTGGLSLQSLDTWKDFIHKEAPDIAFANHAGELYFEEKDFDNFLLKLSKMNGIRIIHPVFEHRWGQRVIRFYDPDGHIIEVGEKMASVVNRFIDSGLSLEETAARMDIPARAVKLYLKELG